MHIEKAARSGGGARFDVFAATPVSTIPEGAQFDVVLLHIAPSHDIGDAITRCLGSIPEVYRCLPTVVYSDLGNLTANAVALTESAQGFLPSTLDSDTVISALRLVAAGMSVFPPADPMDAPHPDTSDSVSASFRTETCATFTVRELDVLDGLQAGKQNKAIARELGLSSSTVKVHVRSVFRKLGVRNRTEAALISGGFVPTDRRQPDTLR